MINDGDRHEYKTRSSTGCILYTVIITTWMINDGDRHGYKTRSSYNIQPVLDLVLYPCLSPSFIIHVVIITVYNIQPVLDLVLYPCLSPSLYTVIITTVDDK
jgi:hypothetical protein